MRIVPVLSQPDDRWKGEQGYVQVAILGLLVYVHSKKLFPLKF